MIFLAISYFVLTDKTDFVPDANRLSLIGQMIWRPPIEIE